MTVPPELWRMIETPRPCSYLPNKRAALECRLFSSLTPTELEFLLERGWRRFGAEIFRPACPRCRECRPIRVNVHRFQISKSQRRTLRRNADIHVLLGPATVSDEHVDLYNRWHVDMTERRGWRLQQTTLESYAESFLMGDFPSLHEMRYYRQNVLVGVGLVDLMPHSLSSAYFFHDPEWRDLGPGTFSGLCEIEFAREQGLDHVYFGYWIADCPSMTYKNRFAPYELLAEFPDDEEPAVWEEQGAA